MKIFGIQRKDFCTYYFNSLIKRLNFVLGDLNYRKLIRDINWLPLTTFKEALGEFQPTAVVALRTLKCDCVCGLNLGYEINIDENDKDNNYLRSSNYWQVNGKYAVIHLNK